MRRVKNANNHDGILERLVKDQIITKLRHDEPTDLRVARGGLADTPSQFRMMDEKISGVEDGLPYARCRLGIVGGNVVGNFVQVARGFGTESGRGD